MNTDGISAKLEAIEKHTDQTASDVREMRKEIETIKIDLAVFKTRWALIAAAGSAAISLLIKFVGGH